VDGRNSGAPRGNYRLGLSQQGNDCSSAGYLHYFRGYSGATYIGRVAVSAWERYLDGRSYQFLLGGILPALVVPCCSGPRKKMPRLFMWVLSGKITVSKESRKNTDDK